MARSSSSDSERRYESISLPIGVVRSANSTIRSLALRADPRRCTHVPGNLTRRTGSPAALKRSSRSTTCVLFPDLSRPSMTMNAPRVFRSGIVDLVKDVKLNASAAAASISRATRRAPTQYSNTSARPLLNAVRLNPNWRLWRF